ncbi:hypothetical protein VB264_15695 [Arcicella aquatica]|uniref:Uncharacterized protein n=1 Tax=Arcicella aquatica TaxID=217141 RepID=A0ABU5QR56_9BACT|nr:hypothetical protein [Arcicella aquatica]MEA5259240.1 hypothetical protein [Arcicella aquatica]
MPDKFQSLKEFSLRLYPVGLKFSFVGISILNRLQTKKPSFITKAS